MTLRAKTRGRKGRDLKRLDGVRRRITRRRLRNQRGGAAPVASYADWLKAVNEENSVYKSRTDPEREDYSISLIKSDSDKHQLPLFDGENIDMFKMPNEMDIRSMAANVAYMLKPIMDKNPTIGQFQKEIEAQLQLIVGESSSIDVQDSLQVLADTEYALRSSGNSSAEKLTKAISSTTDILTNVSKYPLYIWALYYSAPKMDDISVPILTPPEAEASPKNGISTSVTP
jgi:hypothetical protein